MPLYLFECDQCGDRIELLQSYDAPPPVCEPCADGCPHETPYMTRKITASSFVLKGDGWAKDNYGLKSSSSG